MIEAIPTWTENGESVELYEAYHFTDFNAEEITAEIDERMREVRDRQVAIKPAPCTANVVLPAREVSNLIGEIVDSLHFATVYSRANVFSKGDSIQKDRTGDVINVTMCHEIEGSRFSAIFDGDGVTLKDKKVIENGEVKAYYGGHRFGSYLGEDITGELRCVNLEKGTLTEEDIAKEPYFECVSLSGLQLDLYNDYIGGEVRLAYYNDGTTVTPVTGISITGKLSEVLSSIRLAKETAVHDRYIGPKKAILSGMKVF
jgi:PmbA protein